MLKESTTITVTTYSVESKIYRGFYVDIMTNQENNITEAWLYNISFGVKLSLFGVEIGEDILSMVARSIDYHIKEYINEVVEAD